jgi:hypothetical protein
MALEIFPPAATLSAGESQSFEARQDGAAVTGVAWSIAPGHKGKIDPATGVYSSPPMPVFVSKDITVVARKSSAPAEFGAATIHLSCAHSWIVLIAAYVVICAALLSWRGSIIWPDAVAPGKAQDRIPALLQLIMIFGAGGALVHALRSLYGYVGNKQFEPNWAPFYFARPFEGAVLALLTIFMLEDSLIDALPATITLKNVWTVCGVAGLVGLFTDKALRKLEQIFDAVLTPPADTRDGKLTASAPLAPALAKLTPEKATAGGEATDIQLAGDRFESDAAVLVNGSPRATVFQSAQSLSFTLTKADLSQAGTLKISVKGKSATSNELDFLVES